MTARTARVRGFTLVEALTVTAVISIIIAIIVPTVATLRGSARSARCQSNLRQLGVAANAYAMQNRDRYPAAILYELTPEGLVTKAWDFEHGPGGGVRPGTLASFLSNPTEVQQCPDFHGSSTFGDEPYTGYNYNTSYIGAEGPLSGAWQRWPMARWVAGCAPGSADGAAPPHHHDRALRRGWLAWRREQVHARAVQLGRERPLHHPRGCAGVPPPGMHPCLLPRRARRWGMRLP